MSTPNAPLPPPAARRRFALPPTRNLRAGLALLVAFGLGAGADRLLAPRHRVAILAMTPGPIASVQDGSVAAVKGQVADIYGNRFVIADDSGRALVDTGPEGQSGLVKAGEAVTVQGRLERGTVHAMIVTHADGRTDNLDPGPGRGPRPGPHWLRAGP